MGCAVGHAGARSWPRWQVPKATGGRKFLRQLAGMLGSLLAVGGAKAVDLPEDRGDVMYHLYDGGGVKASGPALLLRKKVSDNLSLTGTYYVDMVSNASIDVVTTASPYKETRNEYSLGLDYAVRDTLITLTAASSKEPDYVANRINLDMAQDVFGGMTTVSLGFTRGSDEVGKHGTAGYFDTAQHWQYRLGLTQILSPTWLASMNLEAISDNGYLGSPYRIAYVFGAAVPENVPRTRTSRAVKFRAVGAVAERTAVRAEYRYFWDTWAIKASTLEFGASRYFGDSWLADAWVRYYTQQGALFYSDNATVQTQYITRNRQLSTFTTTSVGTKVAYTLKQVPGRYEIKLNGSYEFLQFKYSDFTDIRTGTPYSSSASLVQLFVTATF